MKRKIFALCLSMGMIAFNSCQKNEVEISSDETAFSKMEVQAEELVTDIDLLADEAINQNLSLLKSASLETSLYLGECPVITIDKDATPQVMTIDFGTACTGQDGKVRSGKIVITAESFKANPSERTKQFEDFYVDGKKIEGTITKIITKDRENGLRTATLEEDLSIIFPNDEGTITREASLTRVYQLNESGDKTDDIITSWGTTETTKLSGITASKVVSETTPIVYKVECHQAVSGIALFTNSNGKSWSIDYGQGECDQVALLTKGEISKEITLR